MVFAAISYMLMAGMAYADTATFTADGDALDNVDLENITATGGGGFNLQGGSTLVIELTNAFATGNFDNFLTVYYANPQRGRRWLGINIGYEVNGVVQWILASPSWFLTRGTGQLNLQVFSNQCSVAGGCTHISLTTWGNSNQGVYVDAVAVNGQVLTADTAAPTPEPSTWMLMILGFFAVAWALKRRKRDNRKTVPLVTALQP
jgi:hypothetical protein